MKRFPIGTFTAVPFLFALIVISRLEASPPTVDSERGARLLDTFSCLRCHRINGKGGSGASDLGWRIGRNFTPAGVAAAMWNHAPEMWAAMRQMSIVSPDLDEQGAGDLFAYFYSVRFFEKVGDAARGRAAFESKGCSRCHGIVRQKRPAAKPVMQWESAFEPIALASAMWNHGVGIAADFASLRLKWPQLTSQDLTDIVIYSQAQAQARGPSLHIEISSGAEGEALFLARGCASCHTGIPALTERLKGKTLTDIAAAMWNHQPKMAPAAPLLTPTEMRGLASYLWATGFFQDSGDAVAGRRVFASKNCGTCHNDHSNAALNLNGRVFSGITLVSALWHHGPPILDQMKAKGFAWPQFEAREMSNLIAFLNSQRRENSK